MGDFDFDFEGFESIMPDEIDMALMDYAQSLIAEGVSEDSWAEAMSYMLDFYNEVSEYSH
jgi:hypothetical protein